MDGQKNPLKKKNVLTEYFKYTYQRFVFFIAVIVCKSEWGIPTMN